MYRDMSTFPPKIISSHGISIGSRSLSFVATVKEAIG